jgi:simple sugar transport system permease protein
MDSKLIPDAATGGGGLDSALHHPLVRPLAALALLLLIDFLLVPGFFTWRSRTATCMAR